MGAAKYWCWAVWQRGDRSRRCEQLGGAGPAVLLGPTKTNRGNTLTSLPVWWRGGLLLYRKGVHTPLPAPSPPCCTCRALTLPSPSHTPRAPPPHTAAPRTPPAFPPRRVPSVPTPPRCDAGSGGAEKGGGARSRRGASPWAGARGSSPPGCQARLGSARLRSARLGSARLGAARHRPPSPPPASRPPPCRHGRGRLRSGESRRRLRPARLHPAAADPPAVRLLGKAPPVPELPPDRGGGRLAGLRGARGSLRGGRSRPAPTPTSLHT